jgi:serine protease
MGGAVLAQDRAPSAGPLAYPLLADRDRIAARARAFNEHLPFVPGEVLVKFRDGVGTTQQVRALSVARGGIQPAASRWIGNTLLVHATGEENAETFSQVLELQPEVEWAQPNRVSRLKVTPNDTSFSRQWNMGLIGMPAAWDISRGGSTAVTVAIIDSGITVTNNSQSFPLWNGTTIVQSNIPFRQNPDIAASRFGLSRDFAFWNGPVLDMVGHGTHVAGTALQETNNDFGFAGIAYNAKLMALKACYGYWEVQISLSAAGIPGYVDPHEEGGCDDADVIAAIRYAADSGAKVINLSLGGPGAAPAFLDVLRYAVQHGVFIAMAGGNEYESGNPVEYPAAYGPEIEGAMTVGAVGRSRRRAYYSNTGASIEIVAPGGDDRDGGLAGTIYQIGVFDSDFNPFTIAIPRFDRYYEKPSEGTSMAAPHIAGVAALLYAQGIRNPAAIEAAIKRFATDLGAPGRDDEYGAGLVDAWSGLRGLGVAR